MYNVRVHLLLMVKIADLFPFFTKLLFQDMKYIDENFSDSIVEMTVEEMHLFNGGETFWYRVGQGVGWVAGHVVNFVNYCGTLPAQHSGGGYVAPLKHH